MEILVLSIAAICTVHDTFRFANNEAGFDGRLIDGQDFTTAAAGERIEQFVSAVEFIRVLVYRPPISRRISTGNYFGRTISGYKIHSESNTGKRRASVVAIFIARPAFANMRRRPRSENLLPATRYNVFAPRFAAR